MLGRGAGALALALLAWAVAPEPAQAQSARERTQGRATIEEAANTRVVTDLLTQTAAVLTVVTGPGTVSSISVPGTVQASDGTDASLTLPTSAAVLDAAGGAGPAGLSVNIGQAGGAIPGAGEGEGGPMLILVQYN